MQKIWLIIQREFITRVTSRAFILTTLLAPLGILLFMAVTSFIFSAKDDKITRIAILDEGNILKKIIKDESNLYFLFPNESLENLKNATTADKKGNKTYNGVLVIPKLNDLAANKHQIVYYSDEQLGLEQTMRIKRKIGDGIRNFKVDSLHFDKKQLEALDTDVSLAPKNIKSTQKKSDSTAMVGAGLGFGLGYLLLLTILILGSQVMRGVMEEKTSRIVEVMISSVKPFELMMGKILGIGAAGLVQMIVWMLMMFGVSFLMPLLGINAKAGRPELPEGAHNVNMEDASLQIGQIMTELGNMNWWFIVPMLIFYFFAGFLLYASVFAAIGSAVGDDVGESQAMTFPVTLPLMFGFYAAMRAVSAPESSLAVWTSIIPLFSPIVMPARLAFNPPMWQVGISVLVLIGTVLGFTWLAGRIYRIGILMYGKKVTFKELAKWIFYKN
jgi:ABC-2 type transport system permease protein